MKIEIKIETFLSGSFIFHLSDVGIKIRNGKATYSSYSSLETIRTKQFDVKNIRMFVPPFADVVRAQKKIRVFMKEYNENYF
jgi:hypothetical protein